LYLLNFYQKNAQPNKILYCLSHGLISPFIKFYVVGFQFDLKYRLVLNSGVHH